MSVTLDQGQIEAINETGNVVITAGPGSGKTLTLTRMIDQATKDLLSYQGIIAISYTNKASNELRGRCIRMGVNRGLSYFGTIDSFCLSEIVAPFFDRIGRPWSEITILEDEDCPGWKELNGLDVYDSKIRKYLGNSLREGKVPIGAICPIALCTLDSVERAHKYIRARYTCIFVDEYQDCSLYQHQLFMRLVSMGLRGVAVGDADQAIYGFMEKNPEYLLSLMRHGDFTPISLTENHRCDSSIHAYASELLYGNQSWIAPVDRRVFAIRIEGDESSIAHAIRDKIEPIMLKYGVGKLSDIAIIGRGRKSTLRVVNELGLPYKFYKRSPLQTGFSRWKRLFCDLLLAYYDETQFAGSFLDLHIGYDAKPSTRSECFGYLNDFFSANERDLANKVDTLKAIADICEPGMEQGGDIEAFVQTVSDLSVLHNAFEPARHNEISVLTYHGAKGLEFDIVFCLDAYEYIMPPIQNPEDEYDRAAEALALHYVGITRARNACYIILGSERHKSNGDLKRASPSAFLYRNRVASLRNEAQW